MVRFLMACAALLAAVPAAAQSRFDFSFLVQRGESEQLAGIGSFTADPLDAAANGDARYTLTGASGTITPNFLSDPAVYTINDVTAFFGFADNVLTVGADGRVSYTSIGLAFDGGPGALLFDVADNAAFGFEARYDLSDFTITAQTAGAVPEPQSWALAIVGLGLAGAALRRRPARRLAAA